MNLDWPMQGRFVRLEPFAEGLRAEVQAALATDDEAWSIMVSNGGTTGFDGWWASRIAGMEALRAGRALGCEAAFAVRRLSDGVVVGSTGFYTMRPEHRSVEIGSTFYRPDARSGPVNPECKLLLMTRAFEEGCIRVEMVTDAINVRSRAAIARLGATEEGVLRRHKITWTGRVRDTVMFSVTDEDWPNVREGLERRLEAFA